MTALSARSEHAGRNEPAQLTGALRREHVEVDAADAALLELERHARADQPRGQLADVRLVPDERDAPLAHVPGELLDHGAGVPAGASASLVVTAGLDLRHLREDVGRLPFVRTSGLAMM